MFCAVYSFIILVGSVLHSSQVDLRTSGQVSRRDKLQWETSIQLLCTSWRWSRGVYTVLECCWSSCGRESLDLKSPMPKLTANIDMLEYIAWESEDFNQTTTWCYWLAVYTRHSSSAWMSSQAEEEVIYTHQKTSTLSLHKTSKTESKVPKSSSYPNR